VVFVGWYVWHNIQRSRAYAQAAKEPINDPVAA